MFLQVKRTPMLYLQHKDMDGNLITPVTSNLRINLGMVAECSIYSIKEEKVRKTLDGADVHVPVGTNIIHFVMSYTHSNHKHHKGLPSEYTINERYFYKLIFFPGADAEFARIKDILDRITAS